MKQNMFLNHCQAFYTNTKHKTARRCVLVQLASKFELLPSCHSETTTSAGVTQSQACAFVYVLY